MTLSEKIELAEFILRVLSRACVIAIALVLIQGVFK